MREVLMAFESLADKLQNVFKNLTGKGRLSESDVKAGLKEVKMALLEADVSFQGSKTVYQFCTGTGDWNRRFKWPESGTDGNKDCQRRAGQADGPEMTEIALKPGNEITVIMMAGLQGAGKTTTTAKLPESSRQREETHCW